MSELHFRMVPISLESNPDWINLSLKRRALFQFIVSKCVYTESHFYQGIELTYGQYVKSFEDLANDFNQTVGDPEDKINKSYVQRALKKYKEINLIKCQTIGSSIRTKTFITITHSDTYDLIKKSSDTHFDVSDTHAIRISEDDAIRISNREKSPHIIPIDGNEETEKDGCDTYKNNCKQHDAIRTTRTTRTTSNVFVCEKDNVQTVPPNTQKKKIDAIAARKYKLNPKQIEAFDWLKEQKINSSDETLTWWAKNYDLERLKEVYFYSVRLCKDNLGGYINHVLKKNIFIGTDIVKDNKIFTEAFKDQNNWYDLTIFDNHVEWVLGNSKNDISLKLTPHVYVDALIHLYEKFKSFKNGKKKEFA